MATSIHWEGHWAMSFKIIFNRNCMNCIELYENPFTLFLTSPQRVGVGSNEQNNAVSSTNILVNYPQPFPIVRLPNMSFLCILDISLNSYQNGFLWKLKPWPSPPHEKSGLVNVTFLYRFGYFMQWLAKIVNWPPPHPMKGGNLWT